VTIDLSFDGGQTSTNLNNVYSYLKDFQPLGNTRKENLEDGIPTCPNSEHVLVETNLVTS
jgi:hypothetical protein